MFWPLDSIITCFLFELCKYACKQNPLSCYQLHPPMNIINPYRIRTDHNSDNTSAIFAEWAENVKELYKSVDFKSSEEWLYPTFEPFKEHDERFEHIAKLRQEGLEEARKSGADYLLVSLYCLLCEVLHRDVSSHACS